MAESIKLFGKTRALENKVDEFLDIVSEACIIFQRAVKGYIETGPGEDFDASLEHIATIESRADDLRRTLETELTEQTLIPDLRADVMTLLEGTDRLINVCQGNAYRFSIEVPVFPQEYHKDYLNMVDTACACADSAVMAARAFFRNIDAVRDHTHKVIFLETETDKISTKLKRAIFSSDISKGEKLHLRYFVDRVDELANVAEDVAEAIAIFAIKRSV